MVNLRGQFAIMVLVCGEAGAVEAMRGGLGELAKQTGLHVELHAASPEKSGAAAGTLAYRLIATALDQPGLVHRISSALRSLEINIESLETHLKPAPYTGAPLFEMELVMAVPKRSPIAQVRQKLSALCDDMNVDWDLQSA